MLLLSPWLWQEMLNVKSKCLSETVTLSDCLSHVSYWFPNCEALLSERTAEGQCFCFSLSVFVIYFQQLLSFYLSARLMSVSPFPLRGSPAVTSPLINLSKTFSNLPLKGQWWGKMFWETRETKILSKNAAPVLRDPDEECAIMRKWNGGLMKLSCAIHLYASIWPNN